MNSLAELKRRMVVDAKLDTIYNPNMGKGNPPTRAVVERHSTYCLMEACDWSKGNTSRFEFPKASELTFFADNPDKFKIDDGDGFIRIYTFVEG